MSESVKSTSPSGKVSDTLKNMKTNAVAVSNYLSSKFTTSTAVPAVPAVPAAADAIVVTNLLIILTYIILINYSYTVLI